MAKFRQIRIDFPHHPKIRPLSSVAKLIHILLTLPNVTGLARLSAKQLARQCGGDVTEARAIEALEELTAGETPCVVWWRDEDVLWLVEAYDEQGSGSLRLRKHAAQHAQSFGPEIYARFCARYEWADDAQNWTRKKSAEPAQGELELEQEREGERERERERERTLSHRVSDRVSHRVSHTVSGVQENPTHTQPDPIPPEAPPDPTPTPPKKPSAQTADRVRPPGDPAPGKKPNANVMIAKALEKITTVSSPNSGPVLYAIEAIAHGRTTVDKVLRVYAAMAEAPENKRPSDLGTIWWKANAANTHRDWLPLSPEDQERLEAEKQKTAERDARAAKDRQRQREIDAGKSAEGVARVGAFLRGTETP